MKQFDQHGSLHIVIITAVTVVIVGAVGFLFWNNVIQKTDETNNTQTVNSQSTQVSTLPSPEIEQTSDPIKLSKTEISKAMNSSAFVGLDAQMASSVERYLSHSDAGSTKASPEETVKVLRQFPADYAESNRQSLVTKWTFYDVKDVPDEKFKKQAANNKYFDNTYVGIGEGAADDLFVAYRFNEQGKINYVFYGAVLGF
jgi:cytoskeletal protein RodZ